MSSAQDAEVVKNVHGADKGQIKERDVHKSNKYTKSYGSCTSVKVVSGEFSAQLKQDTMIKGYFQCKSVWLWHSL